MPDRLIFVLGTLITIVFASGAMLVVREFRRSEQESKCRAARRALYVKPRVIDIDPKESQSATATTGGNPLPISATHPKADS